MNKKMNKKIAEQAVVRACTPLGQKNPKKKAPPKSVAEPHSALQQSLLA